MSGQSQTALQRLRLRRLTLDALLIALALVLSVIERWIPLDPVIPVPGLKLGLANIVTLFALLRLYPLDAVVILFVRSLVMVAITGPVTLLYSLAGGALALLVMWFLSRFEGRAFSAIGISLAGAAAHNIGQVAMAGLILDEPLLLLTYLPPLLLTSLATGTLTGVSAFPVIRRFHPLGNGRSKPPNSPGRTTQENRPKQSPPRTPLSKQLLIFLVSISLAVTGLLLFTGCTGDRYAKYNYEFTGSFDTVIQFIGYAQDESTFEKLAKAGEKRFLELNQFFDAYHDYAGINNVKTINDQAGKAPVKVPADLLQLISKSIAWSKTISDKTNIALGPVTLLWQTYREAGLADPATAAAPSEEELKQVLAHKDLGKIVVDPAAGTVFLADPDMKLDLGAVGKGYATELVAQDLIRMGAVSLIINAGGSNVRLIGKPMADRDTWNVGLQNPQALLPDGQPTGTSASISETLGVLHAKDTSVVTSGDYQRYYLVGNTPYHHLIDPLDGQPGRYFRAVTVVTPDSGLADFLSTALFLMPYDQGRALVEKLTDVEAIWIFTGNEIRMTDGLAGLVEFD